MYLLYLAPVIALGAMVVMIFFLAYNWRLLSDALGFGAARKRKVQKKQSKTLQIVIWMGVWLLAIAVLVQRCGGLVCKSSQTTGFPQVQQIVTGAGPSPFLLSTQAISQLGSIVQTSWFYMAFLGLLIVSSVIIVRSVKVFWDEMRAPVTVITVPSADAITAVEDAIHILESQESTDPRTRIINCYKRMVQAAQQQGAPITSDQTARELETAIRKMLVLRGLAINKLTELFEEARYSLHLITEEDGEKAHQYLLDIAEEMKAPVSV